MVIKLTSSVKEVVGGQEVAIFWQLQISDSRISVK